MKIKRTITCRRCSYRIVLKRDGYSISACDHPGIVNETQSPKMIYEIDNKPDWCPLSAKCLNSMEFQPILKTFWGRLSKQGLKNLREETSRHLLKKKDDCFECQHITSPPEVCPLIEGKDKGAIWSETCPWINFFRPEQVKIQKDTVFSWTCPVCGKIHTHLETDPRLLGNVVCLGCEMVFMPEGTW